MARDELEQAQVAQAQAVGAVPGRGGGRGPYRSGRCGGGPQADGHIVFVWVNKKIIIEW